MSTFRGAVDGALEAGKAALDAYGEEAQELMAVEEMGELLTAIARIGRGRTTGAQVVEEVADVIITVLQVGLIYGDETKLAEAINTKTARLRARLDAAGTS